MAIILSIETATTNCSVSISKAAEILVLKEHNEENYTHSEQLHVFIDQAIKEAGILKNEIDAIAVSKGPGSYTGLRIGVSAAKGLCFALDKPLIAIATLESLSHQIQPQPNEIIIPVLDARRMEVYSAVFNSEFEQIRDTIAEVIEAESFAEYSASNKIHLIGNGAEKCKGVVAMQNVEFHTTNFPSTKEMASIAYAKYKKGDFEDVAYFEPYYLKDFILGGGKKN
ncbi:tRNA (adenosine(37)-N6)-threonylcarbamoyltransferase complex dimerization subunit type 1 TsaB [Croceivirga lutea]|uniref:tRNA (adenosine(37)-N6)-threonylcarbamoyltransferase complex dimerization subunit type 1 TsaB n=1 Tax=Croceivirga lutea TaxID=1775167 RepID=UPI00163953BA|nr:tRNA (adenosine(37)-N6)-threonylcarbamoyltransferase complex dimerization subunit type 1 TsaB [Croceivirga lutea]GGG54271.1 tRNA (adenosine(37)-N6)-threonylcarbamoyltransferase complex dimerization subunit type 1 TsaB [Croceivirga lutea]